MNKNIIIMAIFFITISSTSLAAGKATPKFMTGTTNTTCLNFKEVDTVAGRTAPLTFNNKSPLYPKAINIFGGQVSLEFVWVFSSIDTVNERVRLHPEFEVGYDFENGEIVGEKVTNKYCFGQFDFDKDGIPELIIAVEDENFDGSPAVSINVFQYHPPLKTKDIFRDQNWELISKLDAIRILGDVKVNVKDSSITVNRNLRGFYYETTWLKGRFIDTSDLVVH